MGCALSLDLRCRMISAMASGSSARATARRFDVSVSSAIRLVRHWRETGSYAPRGHGGGRRRKLLDRFEWLHSVLASEPDITLAELQRRLAAEGVSVSLQTINVTLRELGYSYKKKPRTRPNRSAPTSRANAGTGAIGRPG